MRENAEVDGHQLERSKHAECRLQLVDMCNKVIGGSLPELDVSHADLCGISLEQVTHAMKDGSLAARNRLPSVLALCRGVPSGRLSWRDARCGFPACCAFP